MSTNKPRIQAYIDSSLHQQFEQERLQWGVSQSQAFERILSDRYRIDNKLTANNDDFKSSNWLLSSVLDLQNRVTYLESKFPDDSDSELPSELDGKLSLETLRICELPSSLPSESSSSLPSESELVTNDLPSESELVANKLSTSKKASPKDSKLAELENKYKWKDGFCRAKLTSGITVAGHIVSYYPRLKTCKMFDPYTDSHWSVTLGELELPRESELVTGELELVTNDLPSELIITDNLAVSSPGDLSQALSESPLELNKYVICAINKESGLFYYWNGSQKGFSNSMLLAKRYKSEGRVEQARLGILKDDYFRDYYTGNFELRYNTVRYFKENPQYQPKGREKLKA